MPTFLTDEDYMRRALELAEQAASNDEVPVGALVVRHGNIIGEGFNHPIGACDPTAHAEIVALRAAAMQAGNYRLPDSTLYVTLEPCTLCCGAIIHARVARVVFAALEPKAGAVVSHLQLLEAEHFNHRVQWQGGVLAEQSTALLRRFFQVRRGMD